MTHHVLWRSGFRALGLGVQRAATLLAVAAMLAASFVFVTSPARAGMSELPPIIGCFDTVAGAVGLENGAQDPVSGIVLDVPAQIEVAIIEWAGQDDARSGVSSIDLTLTGPEGAAAGTYPGTVSGSDRAINEPIWAWYADVTDLFGGGGAGRYVVDVAPFATPGEGFGYGATITVVYRDSGCATDRQLSWKVGTDYYWGGGTAGVPSRTDVMVYQFAPSDVDRVATVRASHGGADSEATSCRVSIFWAASGSGAPPAGDLVNAAGDPVVAGATEVVFAPFSPTPQGCPAPTAADPMLSFTGGNVGAEWALVEMEFAVPAGTEWLALQLESPPDNGGFAGVPESGAWSGGGTFLIDGPVEEEPAPQAGIVLEKTVLRAPGACPGVEGSDELIVDVPGTAVTYCYRVVNSGDTLLFPISVADPSLGITDTDMTIVSGEPLALLAPGDELVFAFEATIVDDLVGLANAEGIPADVYGLPIAGLDPVTDENDAGVGVVPVPLPVAGIALEKTVLHAPGSCPGVEGSDEFILDAEGTAVTYCYRVVNSGETWLLPVTLDDPSLGITDAEMTLVAGDPLEPLAPGDELVFAFEATIVDFLIGMATTEGVPVDSAGQVIEGLDPVTDENDAGVAVIPGGAMPIPDILLEKTVLIGANCPGVEGVDELVTTVPETEAQFCYRIVNTGGTPLFPLVLVDPDIDVTETDLVVVSGDLATPLLPGDEIVAAVPIRGVEGVSLATVTGSPSTDAGDPIGLDPVSDANDAGIVVLQPGLVLEKTVFEGHSATCPGVESADELVEAELGTPVRFCFRVINSGTTTLFPVELIDRTLGITHDDMTLVSGDLDVPLAPGEEIVFSYDDTLVVSMTNVATVTAMPSNPEGTALQASTLAASNDARLLVLQETLPRTGSSLFEQLRFGMTLLLAGGFVVAAVWAVEDEEQV